MEDSKKERRLTYAEAIREAIDQCMSVDDRVFIIGEGVPDPKGIFGTTVGLREKYGDDRVLDMPLSENGMTGVCIGAALTGLRPVLIHQRLDFSLLSVDQIINNAAKWHYMFGGKAHIPLVIRMVIGRGWGQGAQHSQSLQALFAHIPGLKVVMPSTAHDAKGLLIASIRDNNPVIFIEHRWLHNLMGIVPDSIYEIPLGKANILRKGNDVTIVATSYMVVEAVKVADRLKKLGVLVEVIDVRTIKPLDTQTILDSVKKTGRLLVVDSGHSFCGFAAEIIAKVTETIFGHLKSRPQRITSPDIPTPTTHALTQYYYPQPADIVKKIMEMLHKSDQDLVRELEKEDDSKKLDVPDHSFTGPF